MLYDQSPVQSGRVLIQGSTPLQFTTRRVLLELLCTKQRKSNVLIYVTAYMARNREKYLKPVLNSAYITVEK
jgi:hypothetical protein